MDHPDIPGNPPRADPPGPAAGDADEMALAELASRALDGELELPAEPITVIEGMDVEAVIAERDRMAAVRDLLRRGADIPVDPVARDDAIAAALGAQVNAGNSAKVVELPPADARRSRRTSWGSGALAVAAAAAAVVIGLAVFADRRPASNDAGPPAPSAASTAAAADAGAAATASPNASPDASPTAESGGPAVEASSSTSAAFPPATTAAGGGPRSEGPSAASVGEVVDSTAAVQFTTVADAVEFARDAAATTDAGRCRATTDERLVTADGRLDGQAVEVYRDEVHQLVNIYRVAPCGIIASEGLAR